MKRRDFNFYVGAAAAVPTILSTQSVAAAAPADGWAFNADVAESCSCEIPCPCNFGRRTDLKCEGSRLIQITDGAVHGLPLAGVSFVATFDMGNWTRIYADEAMTGAQRQAFEQIFTLAFGGFKKLMQAQEFVPLQVERSAEKVSFSVPDSSVEIALMRGLNGKPITIDGLPSAAFHNYVQYASVVHRHKSAAAEWSHTDTNGFTSRMIASSAG